MNMKIPLVVVFVTLLAVYSMGKSLKPSIDALGWLAGCWQVKDSEPGTVISEQWMTPIGNAMIGAGRTTKNGTMTEFEYLRIV